MFKIELKRQVQKFLLNHKWENIIKEFNSKLKILSKNPRDINLDIKKLKWNNFYRLRIWKYRFIYEILDDKLIVVFISAWSRWDIYR